MAVNRQRAAKFPLECQILTLIFVAPFTDFSKELAMEEKDVGLAQG